MFQKGMTMSGIGDLIEKMYGHHYTRQTISNIPEVMGEQVEVFNRRKLSARYVCVYLDATNISVRRETVSKEVITYTIAPTESAFNWKELLLEIKKRGLEEVLLFLSDDLTAMVDTITSVFPKVQFQTCLVHVAHKISHKVRVEDRAEICDDFKTVYRDDDQEAGQVALDNFCSKWNNHTQR